VQAVVLAKSKDNGQRILRGQWKVKIEGKSQLRELYILLQYAAEE
jgi:hypothetical protein